MSKRRRGGGLTGGSGGVNPQWFQVGITQAIGTAYSEAVVTLPRERLPFGARSQVMEILKVEIRPAPTSVLNQTAGTNVSARIYLTTSSFGTTEPTVQQHGGKVIATERLDIPSIAASTADLIWQFPMVEDLTDGAGNGVLVATDSIFIGAIQTAATSPINGSVMIRCLYRWKNVGLTEYIGIVQSQQ